MWNGFIGDVHYLLSLSKQALEYSLHDTFNPQKQLYGVIKYSQKGVKTKINWWKYGWSTEELCSLSDSEKLGSLVFSQENIGSVCNLIKEDFLDVVEIKAFQLLLLELQLINIWDFIRCLDDGYWISQMLTPEQKPFQKLGVA